MLFFSDLSFMSCLYRSKKTSIKCVIYLQLYVIWAKLHILIAEVHYWDDSVVGIMIFADMMLIVFIKGKEKKNSFKTQRIQHAEWGKTIHIASESRADCRFIGGWAIHWTPNCFWYLCHWWGVCVYLCLMSMFSFVCHYCMNMCMNGWMLKYSVKVLQIDWNSTNNNTCE